MIAHNARGDVVAPCPGCGGAASRRDDLGNRWCAVCEQWFAVCASCGTAYRAPMSPFCRDQHESTLPYHPFTAYFDIGLGVEVTSHAHRWRLMKQQHLDYRDKLSRGDLSARRDRIEQQKREATR